MTYLGKGGYQTESNWKIAWYQRTTKESRLGWCKQSWNSRSHSPTVGASVGSGVHSGHGRGSAFFSGLMVLNFRTWCLHKWHTDIFNQLSEDAIHLCMKLVLIKMPTYGYCVGLRVCDSWSGKWKRNKILFRELADRDDRPIGTPGGQ